MLSASLTALAGVSDPCARWPAARTWLRMDGVVSQKAHWESDLARTTACA